ncbi:MAG TPA: cytidylate kinase-like family protein [Actinomycetota bacterium]|nr:cytidylate kinase-like family protein [Actinomycetota bacterium]
MTGPNPTVPEERGPTAMGIVTVSRQYGAGGLTVAAALATALGYRFADRDIVDRAAATVGLDPDLADNLDERVPALVEKMGLALAAASPEFALVAPPATDDRLLADEVRRVLESMAAAGGFVVLGRGGQAALRDRPDAVHLQLVADEGDRAARIMRSQGVSEAEARDACRRVDAERAGYVRRFYGVDIADPLLYDAVLNTSRLGTDGAASIGAAVVRRRLSSGPR